MLDIKSQYEEKMKLVGNKFLKYDLTNDTILEEVGRFIEYGDKEILESERVDDLEPHMG